MKFGSGAFFVFSDKSIVVENMTTAISIAIERNTPKYV